MKLIKGKKYGKWTFTDSGETINPASCCHLCGKLRRKWFRFERYADNGNMINYTELGSECIKRFDFNQTNPYTKKNGIDTSL